MKLKKSTVKVLVGTIVLVCTGLIGLQVRLLLNTADLKKSTFDQNVLAALESVSRTLEDRVVMDRMFTIRDSVSHDPAPLVRKVIVGGRKDTSRMMSVSVLTTDRGSVRTTVRDGNIVTRLDRPQSVTIESYDNLGRLDTTFLRNAILSGEHILRIPKGRFDRGMYYLRVRTDDEVSTIRLNSSGATSGFSFTVGDTGNRERVVRRVVESLARPERTLVGRTMSYGTLDSLVRRALTQKGIDIPFNAAILFGGRIVCAENTSRMWNPETKPYEIPVGLPTPFDDRETLSVVFPSSASYLLGQMAMEVTLSVVLIGVLVWTFWFSVRTLVLQKEFAGRLTDFINNMTHEFKTPISTISLAGEALDRSDVRRSSKRIGAYTRVIRDENKRMGNQVERILHMASLEEGDVEFRTERLDVHELVRSAEERFRLKVESTGGILTTGLNAMQHEVLGDRVHIENVIHNLLDNSLKYSTAKPEIDISTSTTEGFIHLRVRDRGIGIPHGEAQKVFEKYYRVPTGNLHDVKGFGLGLSYVKLVVEQHGGSVGLTSTVGQGTEVVVRLPLASGGKSQ